MKILILIVLLLTAGCPSSPRPTVSEVDASYDRVYQWPDAGAGDAGEADAAHSAVTPSIRHLPEILDAAQPPNPNASDGGPPPCPGCVCTGSWNGIPCP